LSEDPIVIFAEINNSPGKKALESVYRGLKQAEKGKVTKLNLDDL
jgi:hypothetical protein